MAMYGIIYIQTHMSTSEGGSSLPATEWSEEQSEELERVRQALARDPRSVCEYIQYLTLSSRKMPIVLALLPEIILRLGNASGGFLEEKFGKEQVQASATDAVEKLLQRLQNESWLWNVSYASSSEDSAYQLIEICWSIARKFGLDGCAQSRESLRTLMYALIPRALVSGERIRNDFRHLSNFLGIPITEAQEQSTLESELIANLGTIIAGQDKYKESLRAVLAMAPQVSQPSPALQQFASTVFPMVVARGKDMKAFADALQVSSAIVEKSVMDFAVRELEACLTIHDKHHIYGQVQDVAKILALYNISSTRIEDRAMHVFDQLIENTDERCLLAFFTELGLNVAVLEMEPRRTNMKKVYQRAIAQGYESKTEDTDRFYGTASGYDAKEFQPRDEESEDDVIGEFLGQTKARPRRGVIPEKNEGMFAPWYKLGRIPILEEVLEEELSSVMGAGKLHGFRQIIRLPDTMQVSAALTKRMEEHYLHSIRKGYPLDRGLAMRCGVDVSNPVVREAAVVGLLRLFAMDMSDIDGSEVGKARRLLQQCALPDSMLDIQEVKDAAKQKMYYYLREGQHKKAIGIRKKMHLENEYGSWEGQNAKREGVCYFLRRALIGNAVILNEESGLQDKLDTSSFQEAKMEGVRFKLKRGLLSEAVSFHDECGFSDTLDTPPYQDAAIEGVISLLIKKNENAAMELRRECKLSDAAIAKRVEAMLTSGEVKTVLTMAEHLPEKVLQRLNTTHFLFDFTKDIGVPSPLIYNEYFQLKRAGDPLAVTGFVHRINIQVEALLSSKKQDTEFSTQPYYQELMEVVCPNNAGNFTTFASNESCSDRTDDLKQFKKVREAYDFTVAPGTDMRLKDGRQADDAAVEGIQVPIQLAQDRFSEYDFDPDRMRQDLDQQIDKGAAILKPKEAFITREEKLFGLFLETLCARFSDAEYQDLVISYQYIESADIRAYVEGTRGRAEQAKNPKYAYLLELREFFADRLKDISRLISDRALQNPRLVEILPRYFEILSARERERVTGDQVDRLQVHKLGDAESFLVQIQRTLQKQTGQSLTLEQVRELIRDYELRTDFLATPQPPEGVFDKAVYGQIRAQRVKTIQALTTIAGTEVAPAALHLGEMNLAQLLEQKRDFASGTYDQDLFAAYLAQSFHSLFTSQLSVIDDELLKYEPIDAENKSAKPKRMEAFISKNHTAAHARGTAGVCVAGDNPQTVDETAPVEGRECQWNLPNFFLMVLRDADSKLCQGCVLLHLEEVAGKKVLTASLNPSSTYLYQVNETEMFERLREQLIVFAKDNELDAIAVCHNPQIRTNRTGGIFEAAINRAVSEVNISYDFDPPRVFSYRPRYEQDKVDCIWVSAAA